MQSQEVSSAPHQQQPSVSLDHPEKTDGNYYSSSITSPSQHESDGELVDGKEGTAETNTAAASSVPPSQNQNATPDWAHGFRLFNIMAAVTFVSFLMLLDGTIIVAAVSRITDDFNSLNDIGWYGAVYQLGRYVNSSFERNGCHK